MLTGGCLTRFLAANDSNGDIAFEDIAIEASVAVIKAPLPSICAFRPSVHGYKLAMMVKRVRRAVLIAGEGTVGGLYS